jgi:hypothetical protein
MEENKRNIEAALFIEVSDDENSIEIVSSPKFFSQGGQQRSSSIRAQVKDVKLKNPVSASIPVSGSILGNDLSVTSQWTEWERRKKFKEVANTVIDTEFAELEAWIDDI